MKKISAILGFFIVSFLIQIGISQAVPVYHTIDFSEHHNYNLQNHVPDSPVGSVELGSVLFDINSSGNNYWDSWYAGGDGDDLRSIEFDVGIEGVQEIHTLINTNWGSSGGPYTWMEFYGSDGAYYRKDLYANDDIRDHSPYNSWADTINGVTTINVFSNSAGDVLDKQLIVLPTEFYSQTLETIRFSDNGNGEYHHRAFLAGITAVTDSEGTNPVPEPSTYLLLLFGLIGMIGIKKKFN